MLRLWPATFELAIAAMIFAIGVGVPVGYFAARRYGGWLDNLSVSASLLGVAIPVFFLAYILKYVFAVQLGWLPTGDVRTAASMPSTRPASTSSTA